MFYAKGKGRFVYPDTENQWVAFYIKSLAETKTESADAEQTSNQSCRSPAPRTVASDRVEYKAG